MTASQLLPRMIVGRLARDQFRTVYPLMREAIPTLSLAHWMRYARRLADTDVSATTETTKARTAKTGILVASRAGAAHPSGAVCYQLASHLEYGSVMRAEHFIALDALFPDVILAALLADLDGIAACLKCSVIQSIVNSRPGHVADDMLLVELRAAGYRAEGVTLLKIVVRE
jgi:hypothetical protein